MPKSKLYYTILLMRLDLPSFLRDLDNVNFNVRCSNSTNGIGTRRLTILNVNFDIKSNSERANHVQLIGVFHDVNCYVVIRAVQWQTIHRNDYIVHSKQFI